MYIKEKHSIYKGKNHSYIYIGKAFNIYRQKSFNSYFSKLDINGIDTQ